MEQGQVPGVVAAAADSKGVHVAVAGVMAIGGAPMQRDTLFPTTSMTNPMTGAAVLAFVDHGLLKPSGVLRPERKNSTPSAA